MDDEMKQMLTLILNELKEITSGVNSITENKSYDLHDVIFKLNDIERKATEIETKMNS